MEIACISFRNSDFGPGAKKGERFREVPSARLSRDLVENRIEGCRRLSGAG